MPPKIRKEAAAMATPDKAALKAKKAAGAPKNANPGIKAPNDHLSAKEEVQGERTVTVQWPVEGEETFDYKISLDSMDDTELLEYFTDDNFVGALRSMLGREQWNAFKERVRDPETRRVPATASAEFLNHIIGELKRKN